MGRLSRQTILILILPSPSPLAPVRLWVWAPFSLLYSRDLPRQWEAFTWGLSIVALCRLLLLQLLLFSFSFSLSRYNRKAEVWTVFDKKIGRRKIKMELSSHWPIWSKQRLSFSLNWPSDWRWLSKVMCSLCLATTIFKPSLITLTW